MKIREIIGLALAGMGILIIGSSAIIGIPKMVIAENQPIEATFNQAITGASLVAGGLVISGGIFVSGFILVGINPLYNGPSRRKKAQLLKQLSDSRSSEF